MNAPAEKRDCLAVGVFNTTLPPEITEKFPEAIKDTSYFPNTDILTLSRSPEITGGDCNSHKKHVQIFQIVASSPVNKSRQIREGDVMYQQRNTRKFPHFS